MTIRHKKRKRSVSRIFQLAFLASFPGTFFIQSALAQGVPTCTLTGTLTPGAPGSNNTVTVNGTVYTLSNVVKTSTGYTSTINGTNYSVTETNAGQFILSSGSTNYPITQSGSNYSATIPCPNQTVTVTVLSQGSQASSSGAASASLGVTRAFSQTLDDHNEASVNGDGSVSPAGTPANASGYAEAKDFSANFPMKIRKSEAFTPAYRVFATGFGGGFELSGGQTGGFYGGIAGLDYQILPNIILGGAVGYSGSGSIVSSVGASGRTSGVNGSLYAIGTAGPFYAQTITTLSSISNHTLRNVAEVGALESASFGSFEVRERLEFGRVLSQKDLAFLGTVKITPFVALEIANIHVNGHSEINLTGIGNAAGLTTAGQDIADVPSFVGMRIERSFDVGNGMILTPIVRLAYVHEFATQSGAQSVVTATSESVIASNGTLLGRNAAQTKAGAELSLNSSTVIFANFDGYFAGTATLYGGRGGIRVSW